MEVRVDEDSGAPKSVFDRIQHTSGGLVQPTGNRSRAASGGGSAAGASWDTSNPNNVRNGMFGTALAGNGYGSNAVGVVYPGAGHKSGRSGGAQRGGDRRGEQQERQRSAEPVFAVTLDGGAPDDADRGSRGRVPAISSGGFSRGGGGARGGRGRGGGGDRGGSRGGGRGVGRAAAVQEEDLDAELDAYMATRG